MDVEVRGPHYPGVWLRVPAPDTSSLTELLVSKRARPSAAAPGPGHPLPSPQWAEVKCGPLGFRQAAAAPRTPTALGFPASFSFWLQHTPRPRLLLGLALRLFLRGPSQSFVAPALLSPTTPKSGCLLGRPLTSPRLRPSFLLALDVNLWPRPVWAEGPVPCL